MDQYEVRTGTAWHRFVILCLVAHASLVVMRHVARQEGVEKRGVPIPASARSWCRKCVDWCGQ